MIRYDEALGFDPDWRIKGDEAIGQRIFIRFRTHKGEWPLDIRAGHPWERWFTEKPTPLDEIRDSLTRDMERTRGVAAVVSAEVTKGAASQGIIADFEVRLDGSPESRRLRFLASPSAPFRISLESI